MKAFATWGRPEAPTDLRGREVALLRIQRALATACESHFANQERFWCLTKRDSKKLTELEFDTLYSVESTDHCVRFNRTQRCAIWTRDALEARNVKKAFEAMLNPWRL